MPQGNSGRKVKSTQQMTEALELRAAGFSYRQIGKALSVSATRAFKIVGKAMEELVKHNCETVEQARQMELHRLNRMRTALESKRSDPRVADTLLRISEREAKLRGLDAPQRIEQSGPDGGPIQTEEKWDLSKLELDELKLFEALCKKMRGNSEWDKGIYGGLTCWPRSYTGPETKLQIGERLLVVARDVPTALPAGG